MSGVNSERAKQEGKKEGKVNKLIPRLLPAAAVAPILIKEGKASARGLRMMKKLGASPELMKAARRELGASWGTYAAGASQPIISSELGRLAGKGYGKLTKLNNYDNDKTRK